MADNPGLPGLSRRIRCSDCGLRVTGPSCACRFHREPSHGTSNFNPRCALCWADVWAALACSLYICAWRALAKLGRRPQA